ncbi:histidine phosphatase family protein [Nocardia iowensis]|uniref:Histidine phosphatase family protein n=1 Tax=Nocardia iowensis TaxID=204891 RepID=A0ABX8RUT5_NOCIO|nr:histidine phosphatase family protein [Nocardia iowensis]QXN93397.1 histidine phosphatase family protein [Nocardia iowensis]
MITNGDSAARAGDDAGSDWGREGFEFSCPHPDDGGVIDLLYAVRHGQSESNVAFAANETVESDDMAIALTELGRRQATAVGEWFAALDANQFPDLVLCSPYRRAVQTWQLAEQELRTANRKLPCHRVDHRLYDRHRGQLKHLPPAVVRERFPEELAKEARDPLGYRPPEGESFKDVAERLRGVVADLETDHRHRRVLIVAHDAIVLFLRQLIEKLTDTEVLALAEAGLAGNGSITSWQRATNGYQLLTYDQRTHLPEN